MPGPRVANEQGETLLELLIAISIMGVAVVSIIGGLVTSVLISDIHRKQATAGASVRDYGEAIENSIDYPVTGPLVSDPAGYVSCTSASTYLSPAGFTVAPAGYTKSVTKIL
jgi:type II secretory pathway pseudopilin PulG